MRDPTLQIVCARYLDWLCSFGKSAKISELINREPHRGEL